ncbi:MAG: molybdenum cofactor cytidylyltransferase [Acidobacteriota bacterium]|jgi:molybdenum cofactor cytidylyltransferase|nr:molybdenum cofactor cytidylyltransferase [Acidobacteriota bacterium]
MAVNGNIAAVLLAAGRSRRMGAFKPLLPWGSVSVVEACVESLRGAGVLEVVVVVGMRGAEVRAALAHVPALRFAVNEEAGSEMGVSLARGVEALREETSAVLVALVDHPAVPPSEVRRLIEARRSTGARLVVPEWQGRGGHPVLVNLAFRAALLSLSPEKGLRALFDAHRAEVLRVPADSPYVARDMDTWEDYLALHTEVFGSPPSSFRG